VTAAKKVMIVGVSFAEQQLIEEHMSSSGEFGKQKEALEVTTSASFGQSATWWRENKPDVLILRTPSDPLLEAYFFTKIKADLPKELPILFICDSVSSSLMQLSAQLARVRILKMPLDATTIWKSIQELLIDFAGRQNIAHRFSTDQDVEITSPLRSGTLRGRLKNLSVTGGLIEIIDNTMGLEKDDLIEVVIEIKGVREYTFHFRVVWIRTETKTKINLGVSFANQGEVLDSLVKNNG